MRDSVSPQQHGRESLLPASSLSRESTNSREIHHKGVERVPPASASFRIPMTWLFHEPLPAHRGTLPADILWTYPEILRPFEVEHLAVGGEILCLETV
jgi:hypothetical protein